LGAALFIFLIYFSIRQVGEEILLGITSSGIGVPQWWYTIGVPVWSILIVLRVFQGAHRVSRKMEKG
jgi:TRAP-type C4-dicarboxylate transport system permease small subunit